MTRAARGNNPAFAKPSTTPVPLDGSTLGESALPHAIELAKKFSAKITLIRIIETASSLLAMDDPKLYEDVRLAGIGQAERYLNSIKTRVEEDGIEVGIHYTDRSDVAGALIDSIEDLGADMVAMSTHGRTGIDRWMFGSVAEKVLRHASVPVVIVRPTPILEKEVAHV